MKKYCECVRVIAHTQVTAHAAAALLFLLRGGPQPGEQHSVSGMLARIQRARPDFLPCKTGVEDLALAEEVARDGDPDQRWLHQGQGRLRLQALRAAGTYAPQRVAQDRFSGNVQCGARRLEARLGRVASESAVSCRKITARSCLGIRDTWVAPARSNQSVVLDRSRSSQSSRRTR